MTTEFITAINGLADLGFFIFLGLIFAALFMD